MQFTKETHVSDVAAAMPATIRIFQQRGLDFCCGGHRPLAEACAEHQIDVDELLAELEQSGDQPTQERDWRDAPLADLIAHIQTRFHMPLRDEIPRLDAMVDKVVSRHGDYYPEMLLALQREFRGLRDELLAHMDKEDEVLFPAILAHARIDAPIEVMEQEHEHAGAALAAMRAITGQYTLPPGACPTFQGLFYGLDQLERDMHVHIHLENNILFPRAMAKAMANV